MTFEGSSFRAIEAVAAPEPPPPLGADTTTVDAPGLVDGVDFTESMADRMFYSGTFGTYVFVRVVEAGDVEIALTNNLTGTDTVNANAVVDGVAGTTAAFGDSISDTVALAVGDHWIRIQMTFWGTTPTGGTYTIRATATTAVLAAGNPPPDVDAAWEVIAAKGTEGPQGPIGAAPFWNGAWRDDVAYETPDQLVSYQGSTYVSRGSSEVGNPPTTGDETDPYWQLVARKGDDGAQGPAGADGPAGPPGADGGGAEVITGTVDFGGPGEDFEATATLSATPSEWTHVHSVLLTDPSPLGDHTYEDTVAEGLVPYVTRFDAAAHEVDVTVRAPEGTWGRYPVMATGG